MIGAGDGEAMWHPSPNHGPRRDGLLPDLLLIHFTKMQTAEAALARLCDVAAEVSAHYLIAEDGRVWQLVDEAARAWHAGRGSWRGALDVNSRSIGIELANTGAHPFPEPQMAALERLTRGIMLRWSILPEDVIGHSDIAPDRKDDPGARFDWRRMALQGMAIWPGPCGKSDPAAPFESFRSLALQVGYGPEFTDAEVLKALRLRWRPYRHAADAERGAQAPLEPADMAVLADIAARFGVDRGRGGA